MPEVELKLELAPGADDAPALAELLAGEPEIVRQRSLYFDTPDQALRKAGLSLRIRRAGARRTQTIKARDGDAGLFVRPEWEKEVDDDRPVPDDRVPLPDELRDSLAELAPVFTVENERRRWQHREGKAKIEISLDHGRILAGERESAIYELELEQKEGDCTVLFALAGRLAGIVRPGVLSKSERGYRLLGPLPAAAKAEAIALQSEQCAEAAFEAIAFACLKQFRLNAPLIAERKTEALHQARVALRRLRSALYVFEEMACDDRFPRIDEGLRGLAATLGCARDVDALMARAGDTPFLPQLEAARAEAYATAETILALPSTRRLEIDLIEWLAIGAWREDPDRAGQREMPVRAFAATALDRLRRKVKKRGRKLKRLDDAHRHALRKSAKKLRYAAEFFAALYRGKQKRRHRKFVATLEKLQDTLGELNDLAVTPGLLDRLGLAGDPRAECLADTREEKKLLKEAAKRRRDLLDRKPFW